MRSRATILLIGLATLIPSLLLAQELTSTAAIGKIISASGEVIVEHTAAVVVQAAVSPTERAKTGDLVYRGDVIQTGRDGKLDVTFADGTTFNVSNNARMTLDEFVYDPNGRSNATFFSLTKGTFNFVAGKIASTGRMRVDTPVGTLGIRGTAPRVEISENGTVTFSTLVEPTGPPRPR